MKICYFDESGDCATLPAKKSNIQPALIITALIIDAKFISYATRDFLKLKKEFYPSIRHDPHHFLSLIKSEIKGADVRRNMNGRSRIRRHAIGFLRNALEILERYDCRIFGRIWVKAVGRPVNEVAIYTSAVQSFYGVFQRYLEDVDDIGCVIGDSRDAAKNSTVAHGIFSKKMSSQGDEFSRIIDLPSFAHSENSTGLQLADLISSAMLWPMVIDTFCKGELESVHIREGYKFAKPYLLGKLLSLQYRYQSGGLRQGGFFVSNGLTTKKAREFFRIDPIYNLKQAVKGSSAPIETIVTAQTTSYRQVKFVTTAE